MYLTRSALIQSLATAALWGLGCSAGSITTDMGPSSENDMGAPVIPGTPRLDSMTPTRGITVGGVALTLTGQDFVPGALVTIDGVPATGVSVTSSTQIAATLPAHLGAFGLVPVVVQNPIGLSATRGDLFSYYATQIDYGPGTEYNPRGGAQTRKVALGDLNGDQNIDVVTANGTSDNISIMMGDGLGGFAAATTLPTLRTLESVAVVDVNGDNKLDVLALSYFDDKLSVFLGDGRGGFAARKDVVVNTYSRGMEVADFNGDKKIDLALTSDNGLNIQLGDGLGGFGAPVGYGGGYFESIVVADWNGDQKLDIVCGSTSNKYLDIYINKGNGTFGPPMTNYLLASTNALAAGDFDGDGKLDLAVAAQDRAWVLRGLGDGKFNYGPTIGSGYASVKAMATADFNGDQLVDIALALSGGGIQILTGDEKGEFAPAAQVSGFPDSLVIADFNRDKKPDVLIASKSYGGIYVKLNQSR